MFDFVSSQPDIATATPTPTQESPFRKPVPRPPLSPSRLAQVKAQNRRREYLDRNPGYFSSPDHELADPLLYDFLIRRFQTPAEREAESLKKGYARTLEGSLLRGEERLSQLASNPQQQQQQEEEEEGETESSTFTTSKAAELAMSTIIPPKTKAQGQEQWEGFLRDRFIRGEDDDFDYEGVFGSNEDATYWVDSVEEREAEEAWFESESAGWASTSPTDDDDDDDDDDEGDGAGRGGEGESGTRVRVERELMGETGVQDF
ncbi:coiled-coil domain-containing protein-domain-containing protein [Podospora australis]|uniref:Coiled-coil domain-containing protein-domain-containing protein n=1 Tax=Podospora australis TaxID=1536484 RepID=A0AAN6WVN3_9PEZI|nr:coiled-coil domain-containing protein-domain-containing protein [Podospora australis]